MMLIDKSGERQACDRCHRVRVKICHGTVCVGCRKKNTAGRSEALRSQRSFMAAALAVQRDLLRRRNA